MSNTIARAMTTLNLSITPHEIDTFELVVASYELRRMHPVALNSQAIALHPMVFTDADRDALFDTFGVDQKQLRNLVQKISFINQDYKVVSDPFNILAVWLMHLGYRDIADPVRRDQFLIAVAKYLHYRFFTSLVNHYFPHGAVEKYMIAAINGLSRKFDIVVYGTWRNAIEARCQDLIAADSIHRKTLERADDDKQFLYIVTDVQGRIRDKVKNITQAYYEARESGTTITSRSATLETAEQGKILVHTTRTLDIMTYNLQNEIMSERLFIDTETVHAIAGQFSTITEDLLRSALLSMVELAVTQADSHQLDLLRMNDGHELYIGMRVFLSNLIQKTYRHCMHSGVDITNKAAVYVKVKNVYSSSRISDDDILSIKQSVVYLVDLISTSRRETTKSSLRLAILLYLLLRSFRFI